MHRDRALTEATLDAATCALLAELVRKFRSHFGTRLDSVQLFGSCARGDNESDSDIDLLVLLRDEVTWHDRSWARRCATSIGYDARHCVAFAPLVLSRGAFEELLARERRLALEVMRDGIAL